MKVKGIGDALIPAVYIEKGFGRWRELGHEVSVLDWDTGGVEELQRINLAVEQHGPKAVEVPQYILDFIKDADILITQFCPVSKTVIDNCPNLKAVGVLRGGVENIDVAYAGEKNVLVFNTPGRNATAVADFTVGMMLAECRNIARSHRLLKEGLWDKDYPNKDNIPDLEGKTAGIIGYGNIGRKVAKRLRGFDMDIITYDPYLREAPEDVRQVSLEELFEEADFVLVHYRLTEETKHMINKDLIARMKPTAYFINTARSGLVDEDALAEALREHRIAGAAIDVFEMEPPGKDYKLVAPDNITITPHLAGSTRDAFTNSPVLLEKDMRYLFEDVKKCRYLLNGKKCGENVFVR